MKTLLRILTLALALGLTTQAQAQATAKPEKAPKAAKVKKHKKSEAAVTPVVIAPTAAPTPVAPVPPAATPPVAPSPPTGTVIDPITGMAVPEKLTTISFAEVNFDFGKIKEGDVVKHKFKFTNTGTNDLILENVKPSCGCTAIEWPKDPIAPGKSGEIEAQFNSTGKSGLQTKYITITLNSAERLERVTFSGEVIPKPVDPKAAPAIDN
jgi:Protein of unknown function (DUF1573)